MNWNEHTQTLKNDLTCPRSYNQRPRKKSNLNHLSLKLTSQRLASHLFLVLSKQLLSSFIKVLSVKQFYSFAYYLSLKHLCHIPGPTYNFSKIILFFFFNQRTKQRHQRNIWSDSSGQRQHFYLYMSTALSLQLSAVAHCSVCPLFNLVCPSSRQHPASWLVSRT